MIEDGDITREQLAAPIQLDEETKRLLPPKVLEHLPRKGVRHFSVRHLSLNETKIAKIAREIQTTHPVLREKNLFWML